MTNHDQKKGKPYGKSIPWGIVVIVTTVLSFFSCIPDSKTSPPNSQTGTAITESSRQSFQTTTFYTKEMKESPTGYGGGVPYDKLERYPQLKILYAGSGFAKEYNEDRSHTFAWEDLVRSKRVTEKTPGSCITCKTSSIETIFAKEGWGYAARKMPEYTAMGLRTISCTSCHETETFKLRVIQPAFKEAMEARGINLSKASTREMKTYVCAQCHSEYYFEPGTDRVVHPWGKGFDASSMYEYYETKPKGFEKDFIQPQSRTLLLKAQHPDFEEYSAGIHAAAKVSCADCHMPKQILGGKRVTSHSIGSPLHTVEASCLFCHKGKTEEWMITRVRYIQDSVAELSMKCMDALVKAHENIAEAEKKGGSQELIQKARDQLRKAQWLWDYTASANSMGFHDGIGSLRNLARALELALTVPHMLKNN